VRARRILVVLSLVLVPSACSGSEPGTITMTEDLRFDPQEITVRAGETVTWTNTSSVPHTVTAYSDSAPPDLYFSSGNASSEEQARDRIADELIQPDETFSFTFEETGSYEYFCIPHEGVEMIGRVIVE
jgi:plastocyanin